MENTMKKFGDLNLMAFPCHLEGKRVNGSNQISMSFLPNAHFFTPNGVKVTGAMVLEALFAEMLDRDLAKSLEEKKSVNVGMLNNINVFAGDAVRAVSPKFYFKDKWCRETYVASLLKKLNREIEHFSIEMKGIHVVGDTDPLLLLINHSLIRNNEMFSGNHKRGKGVDTAVFRHPKAGESEFSILTDVSLETLMKRLYALQEHGIIDEDQFDAAEEYISSMDGRMAIFPTFDPSFANSHGGSDSDGDSFTCVTEERCVEVLRCIDPKSVDYGKMGDKCMVILDKYTNTKKVRLTIDEAIERIRANSELGLSDEEVEAIRANLVKTNLPIETINQSIIMTNYLRNPNWDVGQVVNFLGRLVSLYGSIILETITNENLMEIMMVLCFNIDPILATRNGKQKDVRVRDQVLFGMVQEPNRANRQPYKAVFGAQNVIIAGTQTDDKNDKKYTDKIESVSRWMQYCESRYISNVDEFQAWLKDFIAVMSSVIGRTIDSAKTAEDVPVPFGGLKGALYSAYGNGHVGSTSTEIKIDWTNVQLDENGKIDYSKMFKATYLVPEVKDTEGNWYLVVDDQALRLKNRMTEIAVEKLGKWLESVAEMINED